MASLIESIRNVVTPAVLTSAAANTGEPESTVMKGFGAVIPAILGMLANRADDRGFMTQLASLAATTDLDSLTRTQTVTPSPASSVDVTTPTGAWLSKLFGNNLSGVTDSLARYAGLRGSSAVHLLSMGAPLVLGYLGRMMRRENLDANGLADRLRAERRNLASALPSGFDVPGLLQQSEAARPSASDARRLTATPVPQERASGWLLPLLLAALVIGGLAWWTTRDRPGEIQTRARDAASAVVGTAGTTATMLTRTLPGNVNLRVPAGGIEDRLIAYLASSAPTGPNRFVFDRIGFDTGSASLTQESREQIRNLAAILRAYPNARVVVAGHTDNVGDEAANVELSHARATAVAGALSRAGAPADRIEARGLGSRNPVADNSTETGRAQNRRVTLEVAPPR